MNLKKLSLALLVLPLLTLKLATAQTLKVNKRQLEVQLGDANASYGNVEFTKDGRYMVWFEGIYGNESGKMWHCEINQKTGTMNPPDCRGFSAYRTTSSLRGNVGHDSKGPYYVGANEQGEVILVRPNGAKSGKVQKLSTPKNPNRKGFYPTKTANSSKAYVVWQRIDNETERTLRYIDLANPKRIYNIETQTVGDNISMAPMDVGFFRIVDGAALVTYGALDKNNRIQMKMKDLAKPYHAARFVTSEPVNHIDPYGFIDPKGQMYMVSGIDAKATMYTYKYDSKARKFKKINSINVPKGTLLKQPAMSLSFEPIFVGNKIYGFYQVNDSSGSGGGYLKTSFGEPGEIWMVNMLKPSEQTKVSADKELNRTEPEPLVIGNKMWIFYNSSKVEENFFNAIFNLKRTSLYVR